MDTQVLITGSTKLGSSLAIMGHAFFAPRKRTLLDGLKISYFLKLHSLLIEKEGEAGVEADSQ